ncbi:site-specific integrase [Vibrio sp. Vb339]|uniref:site-specific integrase n=1 Tax=Vibrio sp. Vb339 TaxID=1192013 RepID=UPI0015568368|nr:site-specific integrase [Vibrio sp. Vb339]
MYSAKKNLDVRSDFSTPQIEFIKAVSVPKIMEITVGSEFDTAYVTTNDDRWEYVRFGRTHVEVFNLDKNTNKLLKLLSVKFTDSHMAPLGSTRFDALKRIFKTKGTISFSVFYNRLEVLAKQCNSMDYFLLKSVTKTLIRIGFPGFDVEDEEKMLWLSTPNVADPFLRYSDIEDTMPTHLKNLIINRLVEFSTRGGLSSLSDPELKNLSILGLSYAVGLRPQQFSMLKGCSISIVTKNHKTALSRYQISIPLAKQQKVPASEFQVALSQEVGVIIDEYKKRFNIELASPLYPYTSGSITLSQGLHAGLNAALLFIQPDEVKQSIKQNIRDRPIYTLYDFRHNIGHSMAMLNASAEEIAAVLGHSSLVAAQHYINAVPELAILKHKCLGQNPVWKDMVSLLLTGYKVNEKDWVGNTVSGVVREQLVLRIGGCNRRQEKCHLVKVRSCYGCFYFRPFNAIDKHKKVLQIFSDELIDLVRVSHDSGNKDNPLIDIATQTKNEVEMVINRLEGGLR